jgi:hypothetical protein
MLVLFALVASALADAPLAIDTNDVPEVAPAVDHVDFATPLDVRAGLVKPGVGITRGRQEASFISMIRVRAQFDDEMVGSVAEIR